MTWNCSGVTQCRRCRVVPIYCLESRRDVAPYAVRYIRYMHIINFVEYILNNLRNMNTNICGSLLKWTRCELHQSGKFTLCVSGIMVILWYCTWRWTFLYHQELSEYLFSVSNKRIILFVLNIVEKLIRQI